MRVTARMFIYVLPLSLSGVPVGGDCPSQIGDQHVLRVAGLRGSPQHKALRRLMARYLEHDEERFPEAVFYCGDRLRPALRSLVQDPEFGEMAVSLLAFIAVPEDLRVIIQSPPRPRRPGGPIAGLTAWRVRSWNLARTRIGPFCANARSANLTTRGLMPERSRR